MSDFLPDELVIEVLKRVEVKSLLRFRCVSKSWYSLISNSAFIVTHLHHALVETNAAATTTSHNHKLIIRHRSDKYLRRLSFDSFHPDDDETFDKSRLQLQPPIADFTRDFRIVGCCNGLICAVGDTGSDASEPANLILWNPSIRKHRTLPEPSIGSTTTAHNGSWCTFGFGYNPMTDDYMVVRFVFSQANDGSALVPPEVELFELSTGLWRPSKAVAPPYTTHRYSSPATLKGVLHWMAFERIRTAGIRKVVVSFDMNGEVFGEVALPSSVANGRGMEVSVAVCGDLLSLLVHYKGGGIRRCEVWLMKEYGVVESWSKVCTIDLVQGVKSALCFRTNGELLVATVDRELYSYDLKNRQAKYLGIYGSEQSRHDIVTCSLYVESLLLLERATGITAESKWFN